MARVDLIKNSAFMVLGGLAFVFDKTNSTPTILVYNLKNISQYTKFVIMDDGRILFTDSNMSEANKWKSIALVERNKSTLIEGYKEWVSIQRGE